MKFRLCSPTCKYWNSAKCLKCASSKEPPRLRGLRIDLQECRVAAPEPTDECENEEVDAIEEFRERIFAFMQDWLRREPAERDMLAALIVANGSPTVVAEKFKVAESLVAYYLRKFRTDEKLLAVFRKSNRKAEP